MTGKTPLLLDDLRRILDALPETLPGTRDRALLLLGFAGALRRSELVGIDVADLEFVAAGLIVHLRRSKTDPAGAGREIGIPLGQNPATCPVAAVKAWLTAGDVGAGPVFRAINKYGNVAQTRLSDAAVVQIVKRSAYAAGLDPRRFAGHSMRAGLATQAAMNGVAEADIQRQTGHKSVAMLRRYVRLGSLFLNNASGKVGL